VQKLLCMSLEKMIVSITLKCDTLDKINESIDGYEIRSRSHFLDLAANEYLKKLEENENEQS